MSTLVADAVRTPRVPRGALLRHAGFLTARSTRALWRQPAFAAATLVQPIIWLLLFGALFKAVTQIPGFHGGSYIEFLTPGVVVIFRSPLGRSRLSVSLARAACSCMNTSCAVRKSRSPCSVRMRPRAWR